MGQHIETVLWVAAVLAVLFVCVVVCLLLPDEVWDTRSIRRARDEAKLWEVEALKRGQFTPPTAEELEASKKRAEE